MIISLFAIPAIATLIGFLLGYAAIHLKIEGDPLVEEISALLPNAQCGQCGYPGCKQLAESIAKREAPVDTCLPGGASVAEKIAKKLGITFSQSDEKAALVAVINPARCDGCGRCSKQCAFDAIIGATKQMHGVLIDACTGCGACLTSCPNSSISLYPDPLLVAHISKPQIYLTRPLIEKNNNLTPHCGA